MLLTVVGTLALSLIGYALLAPFGIQIFNQRYMTVFVALVAILAACSLVGAGGRRRPLIAAAFTALAALGVGNAVRRAGGQFQPDLAPVRAAAVALHPAMVLTNTPTVLYYLRSLHPILDRPSNLGPGDTAHCRLPCLAIDYTPDESGPPRRMAGARRVIGDFVLTFER
jgi:hypothetical protein